MEEEEEEPELPEEKLETEEALERNEKLDRRDFLLEALLRWLGWMLNLSLASQGLVSL